MATTKKMTKADYFKQISASYPLTVDEQAFIAHELELLARKNSAEKKPTAKQTANKGIQTQILEAMEDGRRYTITELIKEVPDLPEDMTNQKMSALVRQMLKAGLVEREEIKRRAYFFKV